MISVNYYSLNFYLFEALSDEHPIQRLIEAALLKWTDRQTKQMAFKRGIHIISQNTQ